MNEEQETKTYNWLTKPRPAKTVNRIARIVSIGTVLAMVLPNVRF